MNEQSNEAIDDPSINGLTLPGPDRLGIASPPLVFTPGSRQSRLEAPRGLVPTHSGMSASAVALPEQGV